MIDKIREKIRALLNKTTDNGCTEAEAMSAVEKARALMDAYEITPEALEMTKEEKATIREFDCPDPNRVRNLLCVYIAEFCDCKVWGSSKTQFTFCGLPADTEFAGWLLDSLSPFVLSELANFLMGQMIPKQQRRRAIGDFVSAATNRIGARLRAIKSASQQQVTSNGRALVVVKTSLVKQYMAEHQIRLSGGRTRTHYASSQSAVAAGRAAGDRASFGRPVSGAASALRIR